MRALVLFGEVQLRDEAQPFLGDLRLDGVGQRGDALEHLAEHAVEAIEVALVFDEAGARQEVEVLHLAPRHARVEPLEQRQVLLERDRQPGALQCMEEGDEHRSPCGLPGSAPGLQHRKAAAHFPAHRHRPRQAVTRLV